MAIRVPVAIGGGHRLKMRPKLVNLEHDGVFRGVVKRVTDLGLIFAAKGKGMFGQIASGGRQSLFHGHLRRPRQLGPDLRKIEYVMADGPWIARVRKAGKGEVEWHRD